MQQLITILTLFGLLTSLPVLGQSEKIGCDIIYYYVETISQYENDVKGLMDYLSKDLTPLLSDCFSRDSLLPASMYLTLTIDKQGQVIDINFKEIQATDLCKDQLRQKLMTMTGWIPGQKGGFPVCSRYLWPIRCIYWK